MSVNGAIATFATGTYTVSRRGTGVKTLGRYTPASATTLTIEASIQPVRGRDLQLLPEGFRAEETRVLYTTTELRTQGAAGDPDRVTIDGETWIVCTVQRWEFCGETHYRAFLSRNAVP